MAKTKEEMREIKERYMLQYWKEPINACGISKIALKIDYSSVSDYPCPAKDLLQKNPLQEGESLEDLCISVSFEAEPSKDMYFPTEFEGVRVFYRVGGKIRPL